MVIENPGSLTPAQRRKIQALAPLAHFTTWRVGGPAEWLAEPKDLTELRQLVSWAKLNKMPCQILGAGSNLLISDAGLKGLTLCMKRFHGCTLDKESGVVNALGGEYIPTLSRRAAQAGLHGLEWAVGIPGTIGGAAVMNAGAQGGCFANHLISIQVLPLNGKEPFEIKQKDLKYEYRQSLLQTKEHIVLSAHLILEPGHNEKELTQITNRNLNHRTSTQPYHYPSCGSVFRNPEPLKAAQLIEDLGLKGHRIGGAEISTIHANFIVNTGQASASNIKQLMALVQKKVQEKHGLTLHPEVKQLGFEEND